MTVDFRGLQERLRRRLLAEIAAGELTGLELARQTGFRQGHISNFLNRKRGLSLEAMDAILRVRKLGLTELLGEGRRAPGRARTIHASSSGKTYVPLVEPENCYASEVPYSETKNALSVVTSRLQKLGMQMHTPRPHWRRFVAMRVSPDDGRAMAPRLERGSVVVVDRHSNGGEEKGSIYVAKHEGKIVMRYVERAGEEFVLKAENAPFPLLVLEKEGGRDPLAAIVGRVCLVIEEV